MAETDSSFASSRSSRGGSRYGTRNSSLKKGFPRIFPFFERKGSSSASLVKQNSEQSDYVSSATQDSAFRRSALSDTNTSTNVNAFRGFKSADSSQEESTENPELSEELRHDKYFGDRQQSSDAPTPSKGQSGRNVPKAIVRSASKSALSRSFSLQSSGGQSFSRAWSRKTLESEKEKVVEIGNTNEFLRERSRERPLSEPPHLVYSVPGKSWGGDVMCMMHNGIRKELFDLYYILGSMSKRKFFLETFDFDLFFEWLAYLSPFFSFIYNIKEEFVYKKLIERGADASELKGLLEFSRREKHLRDVTQRLVELGDSFDNGSFSYMPPGERVDHLINKMGRLGELIVDTIFSEQLLLPKLLDEHFSEQDRESMLPEVCRTIRESPQCHRRFIMFLRWFNGFENSPSHMKLKDEWKETFFDTGNVFSKRALTREHQLARVEFREGHGAILGKFYQRWNDFERNVTRKETCDDEPEREVVDMAAIQELQQRTAAEREEKERKKREEEYEGDSEGGFEDEQDELSAHDIQRLLIGDDKYNSRAPDMIKQSEPTS